MGILRITELPNQEWRIEQFSIDGKLLNSIEGPFFTLLMPRTKAPPPPPLKAGEPNSNIDDDLPVFLTRRTA